MPPPLGLDKQFILSLQQLATACASGLLDLLGFPHLVSGVVLELPQRAYMVEEACSGINSLFAVLSCTLFYLILCRRNPIRSIVLIAAAILWVLVCNAARVTLVTVLSSKWDLPVAEGVGHDIVGVLMFAISIALICSTDQLVMFVVPEGWIPQLLQQRKQTHRDTNEAARTDMDAAAAMDDRTVTRSPQRGHRFLDAYALCLAFVVVAGLQLVVTNDFACAHQVREEADFSRFNESLLPAELQGWTRVGFDSLKRDEEDPNGQYSHQWRYQRGDQLLVLSVDGPFIGWHNLSSCLEGQGWKLASTSHVAYESLGEPLHGGFTEIDAAKSLGQSAFIMFGVFDEQNRGLQPAETYLKFRAVRRFPQVSDLIKRIVSGDERQPDDSSRTYQIQLFQPTPAPLNESQKVAARTFFHEARHHIIHAASPPVGTP